MLGQVIGTDADLSNDLPFITHKKEGRPVAFLAVFLCAASLAAFSLKSRVFVLAPTFVTAFVGITGFADLLTAIMLFEIYAIDGEAMYLGAASAYLLDALLVWPYGIMFPGILPGHPHYFNEQSSVSLWLMWHISFPTMALAGITMRNQNSDVAIRKRQITTSAGIVVFIGIACVLMATLGHRWLPIAINRYHFTPLFTIIVSLTGCLNLIGTLMLLHGRQTKSLIRSWLVVAMFASSLDTFLNALSPGRFTAPWYAGKFTTLITSSVVLLAMLRMWLMLYTNVLQFRAKLHATLSEHMLLQERLNREHIIARTLQAASLPTTLPTFDDLRLSAVYRPAVHDLEIGGDWYDMFAIDEHRVVLTVGDVAGKGLAASLIMGKIRQALRIAAHMSPNPVFMLEIADQALRQEHPGTIVTAFAAILDRRNGLLQWSSAGHPPPLIRHADGSIEEIGPGILPLGSLEKEATSAKKISLEPGAMLVVYTDGLIEAEHDIIGGLQRLHIALSQQDIYKAHDPATIIFEQLVGETARDDVAIIVLSYDGKQNERRTSSWEGSTTNAAEVIAMRGEISTMLFRMAVPVDVTFAVELVFSELVSNIISFAPGRFVCRVDISPDSVELFMRDFGHGFDRTTLPATIEPTSERGRGLIIVRSFATKVDVLSTYDRGTEVRAAFATSSATSYNAS